MAHEGSLRNSLLRASLGLPPNMPPPPMLRNPMGYPIPMGMPLN